MRERREEREKARVKREIERVKEMIHSITNQDSSFNSDTLFILSNKNNHRTFSLKYKSAIPNEVADYSIITLKVVDNNIRVFIGCNPYIKYISYKDILPENNLKSINKLILVIKLDLKQKYSKFVIFADDLRIDNEFKYLFSSEPINRRTLFYNNPLIEINVPFMSIQFKVRIKQRCDIK